MIPLDLIDMAVMVGTVSSTADLEQAASFVAPWIRENPDSAALVMVAMVDLDKLLRDAHAAYNRGVRTDVVKELERRYQSTLKAKNRPYLALQKSKQDGQGAA